MHVHVTHAVINVSLQLLGKTLAVLQMKIENLAKV